MCNFLIIYYTYYGSHSQCDMVFIIRFIICWISIFNKVIGIKLSGVQVCVIANFPSG